jgi:ABC-type phosphate transport system auxiliary subunit
VAPEAEALEAEALEEVRRTHYLVPAKMATYLPQGHLAMVRGDWGDRRGLAYQALEAEVLEAEALEAEVLEAEVLEAEALEAEVLEAEVLEAEVLEAQALEAVRGQCQNRQIQEEGGVLRARTASFPKIALAALRLTIRI